MMFTHDDPTLSLTKSSPGSCSKTPSTGALFWAPQAVAKARAGRGRGDRLTEVTASVTAGDATARGHGYSDEDRTAPLSCVHHVSGGVT